MKKTFLIALGIVGVFVGMVVVGAMWTVSKQVSEKVTENFGSGFVLEECYGTPSEALYNSQLGTATATMTHLQTNASASSTLTCYMGDAELIDLNIHFIASSSSSRLEQQRQFSYDGVNWFDENGESVDSAIQGTNGFRGFARYLTPGGTATTSRNYSITPLADKYVRIKFGVTGANGALWAQIIKSKPLR